MDSRLISDSVQILLDYARAYGATPNPGDVAQLVEGVLYGEHALLDVYTSRIVTSQEVSTALLDRFDTSTFDVVDTSSKRSEAWPEVASKLHVAIFGVESG